MNRHGATHFIIPDTQCKPGVPVDHLGWIGRYMVEKYAGRDNVRVIHLGDHWDMPSLSSYDRGKRAMEGRRVARDLLAGNEAFGVLNAALEAHNSRRRRNKERQWWPDRHFIDGNHEDRITRATEDNPQLEGFLTLDSLDRRGWTVHPFKEPVMLDGVAYAHFFYNPMTGRPYAGTIENRLRQIGHSFTMGHQQTFLHGVRYVLGDDGKAHAQHGIVAGACYLHDEEYKGPQGNGHWRGIVVCHEVADGDYSPMIVTLDFLCRRYEGMPLSEFTPRMVL